NATKSGFNIVNKLYNVSLNNNSLNEFFIMTDTVLPDINFTFPTPANGSTRASSDIYVNLTTNDSWDHYSFVDFDNDLVLWMRMDDVNGSGDPTDLSVYSNNGSAVNDAVINNSGYFGKGFSFDGETDYINIPSSDSITQNFSEMTISAWVKTIDLSNHNRWFRQRPTNTQSSQLGISTSGAVFLHTVIDGAQINNDINNAGEVLVDTWYLLTFVYNGTNWNYYRNGEFRSNGSFNSGTVTCHGNFNEMYIGHDTSGSDGLNGTIDDFMIFNRSLSAAEISSLYNASANQYYNNFTNLSEGIYNMTGYSVDSWGNKNQTLDRFVTIDTTAPVITNVTYENQTGVLNGTVIAGENLTINATVTDASYVWAIIWQGAVGFSDIVWQGFLNLISGNMWSVTITTNASWPNNTALNFTVYANDSVDNVVNFTSNISIGNIIQSVSVSPLIVGLGQIVNISAVLVDTNHSVVWVGVTRPGEGQINYSMTNDTSYVYNYTYNNTFKNGSYSIVIYVNDSSGVLENSSSSFDVFSNNITVQIRTLRESYQSAQIINLTDPPGGSVESGLSGLSDRLKEMVNRGDDDKLYNKIADGEKNIIEIVSAKHLDSERNVLGNIYDGVYKKDNLWSDLILEGEYVRVTFEQELDNSKDIKIYARGDDSEIGVYESGSNFELARFVDVNEEEWHRVLLDKMIGRGDEFDLRVLENSVEFDYIVDPVGDTNTWNCSSSQNFDNASCWDLGSVPVGEENIVFNASGIGNCNITNNTMPQNLSSFTVDSDYSGTIYFMPLFAVGDWTGNNDGTVLWNVTNDINISGGTMKIYGDYLHISVTGVNGNITDDGHGAEWRSVSGNIIVGESGVIDGVDLGFLTQIGPGSNGNGDSGASYGGHG
ncbi:hypothetical protein GOV12_06740, partial [Candidatus Pacearchaeota archaeon]|nr:hypothetical protein [Candidatus Pacearchaeota archaeon]